MKTLRILLLLLLTFSITLTSLTSCEMIEELGINLPDILGKEDPKEEPTPDEKVDPANCGHYVTATKNRKEATCSTEGYTGDDACIVCGTVVKTGKVIATTEHSFKDGKCTVCGADAPVSDFDAQIEAWKAEYSTITIAEALTLCEQFVASPSTDRYYIIATVKSVDNTSFGQLMIEDETGAIMVYGTNNADGSLKYDQAGLDLKAGDLILIYGTLQNYQGNTGNTKEVQNAWLIDHVAGVVVPPSIDVSSGDTITIEKALEIAGSVTLDDYFYITATVKSVTNAMYGEMVLVDETGEISVYNSKNADGTVNYENMSDKPYKGDTVLVKAIINVHKGTPQIKQAYIIEFTHNEPDINPDDYTLTSIADARLLADETVVKVQGVVARFTYAYGMKPSGFYLVDGTNSIYVYDSEIAARVAVGNTVTVVGVKDHWILEGEQSSANKFGYKGCNQLTNCVLADNDGGNSAFDTAWITENSVKGIMDTPVTEDITTTIFKVTALVKRVDGSNFVNYYIDDLDGVTGSYVYTQCSGSDFAWLDQFDGKICTVYLSVINAKSNASDCNWRFFPVAVIDEGFTFDPANAPQFAIDYFAKGQFLSNYTANPALALVTKVSSELLGFENVALTYTSSNSNVADFTTDAEGNLVMNLVDYGTTTITVTATHNGNVATWDVIISFAAPVEYEYISVEDAILAEDETTVTVKGIVGPSLVNKVGFYLMGENGLIAVVTTEDIIATLSIGDEVIIQGKRELYIDPSKSGRYGQTAIVNAEVLANYYGNHKYNDSYFITGKTAADINGLDINEDHTTEVYVMDIVASFYDAGYYTSLTVKDTNGTDLKLYMSGAGQYSWMSDYYGQTITVELAPCNWNDKKDQYRVCILAIILEDGTKIYNTSNW